MCGLENTVGMNCMLSVLSRTYPANSGIIASFYYYAVYSFISISYISRNINCRYFNSAFLNGSHRPQASSIRQVSNTTLDPEEVKKFQTLADKWWDQHGEFAALHSMNDLRVPFIRCISQNYLQLLARVSKSC